MTMVDITRHSGIISADVLNRQSATIIGVGAIGSKLAEVLVKMGTPKITIMDDDIVATHNVSCQGYGVHEVGSAKVECLQQRLTKETGAEIIAHCAKLTKVQEFSSTIVASAVDTMSGRKLVFNSFMMSPNALFFLDGRMAARFGSVYVVDKRNPASVKAYRESLCEDDEVVQLPCTQKSTIFCAYGLVGFMGELLTQFMRGEAINFNHLDVYFEDLRLIQVSSQT